MTATPAPSRRTRLQRSELAVPATSKKFFTKAAASDADCIFLDLEDAVANEQKEQAREMAIEAINTIDWGRKAIAVRVNGLDTKWALQDIAGVAARCPRLDMILLPKAGTAFDIQFVAHVLELVEREHARPKRVGIEALIESALGVANVESIAAASDRLEALIFGIGDYTIDMRTHDYALGVPSGRYAILTDDSAGPRQRHWNDQWHFAMARIVNACRANGLRAIDGPYPSFADMEGFLASAQRGAALGFEGKWAIHPSQVAGANRIFSPSADQVAWSERITARLADSLASGIGAFSDDGVLVDLAHAKLAHSIERRVQLIESESRT